MSEQALSKPKKEMPAPVKMAIEFLAAATDIDDAKRAELQKTLPAYAFELMRRKEEVTHKKLAAFARGDSKIDVKTKPEETIFEMYKRIVGKKVPEAKRIITGGDRFTDMAANGEVKKIKELTDTEIRYYLGIILQHAAAYHQKEVIDILAQKYPQQVQLGVWDVIVAATHYNGLSCPIVQEYLPKALKSLPAQFDKSSYFFDALVFRMGRFSYLESRDFFLEDKKEAQKFKDMLLARFRPIDDAEKSCKEWIKVTRDAAPIGLENFSPLGVPMKTLKNVFDLILRLDLGGATLDPGHCNLAAYNLALLFQSEERVLQFYQAHIQGKEDQDYDLRNMLAIKDYTFPQKNRVKIDFKAWADAILKHGFEMLDIFAEHGEKMERPALSDDGKSWSLNKTRDLAAIYAYKKGAEHVDLARIFNRCEMSEEAFEKAIDLIAQRKKSGVKSNLPDLAIPGKDFDMPKAVFKKLPDGDIRGLVLGKLTDCCQHLDGNAHRETVNGFIKPDSGFYVLVVPDKHGEEEVIGQCWAWRGQNDELVFDSIETLGQDDSKPRVTKKTWHTLLRRLKVELEERHPDIQALYVGTGGNTRDFDYTIIYNDENNFAVPKGDFNAYDSKTRQLKVWTRRKKEDRKSELKAKTMKQS